MNFSGKIVRSLSDSPGWTSVLDRFFDTSLTSTGILFLSSEEVFGEFINFYARDSSTLGLRAA